MTSTWNSKTVTLPVGLDWKGARYRNITIDEMKGFDEENIADPKLKNNGAKAITVVLRRCIQEIEGLLPRKQRIDELVDEKMVLDMYVMDRDYLFMAIQSISGKANEEGTPLSVVCPQCEAESEHLIKFDDLEFYDWPEAEKAEIIVPLPSPVVIQGETCTEATWGFLTGKQQELLAALPRNKMMTSLLAAGIKKIGKHTSIDTQTVRSWTFDQRMAFFEAINMDSPGVNTKRTFQCSNCGNEWEGAMDVSRFFARASQGPKKASVPGKSGQKRLRRA